MGDIFFFNALPFMVIFFPECLSLPSNQSTSVGKMLMQFVKSNKDPGFGFVLVVRDLEILTANFHSLFFPP